MTLEESILHSISRKQSNKMEAYRLGMEIDYYIELKKRVRLNMDLNIDSGNKMIKNIDSKIEKIKQEHPEIIEVHENLDNGSKKLIAESTTELKSPEEIIKLLKIDTKKWKLSQYWNKQKNEDKWIISALVSKVSEEIQQQQSFLEALSKHKIPTIKPVNQEEILLSFDKSEKVCGVISLQDLHFGKPNNDDIESETDNAIKYLVKKASVNYFLENIVLIVGPDTLHVDTFDGKTTKGTQVEYNGMPTDFYIAAFDSMCKTIVTLKQFCVNLEVMFIPGNHDRLSSFHLLHAISQTFKDWKDIHFNIEYLERKVLVYGNNFIAAEHGDVHTNSNVLLYATEFAKEWGITENRILYTGHTHGRKTKELITENEVHGFTTRTIPSLTGSDYWHYHNKYTGNTRTAIMHIHEKEKGLIGEYAYNV